MVVSAHCKVSMLLLVNGAMFLQLPCQQTRCAYSQAETRPPHGAHTYLSSKLPAPTACNCSAVGDVKGCSCSTPSSMADSPSSPSSSCSCCCCNRCCSCCCCCCFKSGWPSVWSSPKTDPGRRRLGPTKTSSAHPNIHRGTWKRVLLDVEQECSKVTYSYQHHPGTVPQQVCNNPRSMPGWRAHP